MWQACEKEKDKIKTATHVLKGCWQNVVTNNEAVLNTFKGTLYMKYRSFFAGRCGQCCASQELAKGRFSAVLLKKISVISCTRSCQVF